MLRRLGLLFAALALFSIAGGHWGVLQTVAWVEMLQQYHQQGGSVATAVEQTFDGKHPCALCREIQAAKSKERKSSPALPGTKDDAKVKATLATGGPRPLVRSATGVSCVREGPLSGPGRTEPPPVPPPRRMDFAA